ncbi:ABC transporter [Kalaharituber pfeilii]|nr:ABC transporter [Kalaharituber pfeilii]
MVKLFRQTWALTKKTLLIAAIRFGFSTCIRAFVMPVIFIAFLAYARNLFQPPADYGIGTPAEIKRLVDEIGGRRLILIRNGLGGDVQEVIDGITKPVIVAGKDVRVLENDNDLSTVCKQSLRGASDCYAVAVFVSSPENPNPEVVEGNNAIWNYTLRADGSLGRVISVENHRNDIQERLFPLQHAIDFTIAKVTENKEPIVPQEYMYTDETKEEREADIRRGYQGTIISAIGVTFLIGMIGVVYQLVGFMAMEREQGLSQLIEAMGGSNIARLLSYHLAFDIIYAPGWIVIGVIMGSISANTNRGILIIEHLLMGLALSSWSLFGAVFFKKAQLSGITVTIVSLLLGVVAQIMHSRLSSGAIAILGILFPPMNYLFFTVLVARFERQGLAVNLTESAPENPWGLAGIYLWIFCVIHIIGFSILALLVENWLYGVADKGRLWETSSADNAVEVRGFSKLYVPGFWDKRGGIFMRKSKRMDTVVAVNDLSLDVRKGSVVGLLGANGSGKTTTLESIVGLGRITKGTIAVSGRGKIGVCPQKNVLWDHLTVGEHVKIWNKLKCEGDPNSVLHELIRACDLEQKIKAQSRTLSGGQKRKLQLAIMFTGGSNICAVDEVSSGLDPLSRRKIWDIILEARGRCTIIHTTHFLDEADLLSDHIAILSKGQLKAEGSSVELKAKLGGGYRVSTINDAPDFEVPTQRLYDQTVYNVPDSATAGRLIHELEKIGIDEYHVNGPTIEDVFLKVAEDSMLEAYGPGGPPEGGKEGVDLYPGKKVGVYTQAWVMYRKRMVILRRNYLPTLAAVAIPIIAAGITMLLFDGYEKAGCSPDQINMEQDLEKIDLSQFSNMQFKLVVGPESVLPKLSRYAGMLMGSPRGQFVGESSSITELFDVVGTLDEFNNKISTGYAEYSPGGLFLRENEPTIFAFTGNNGLRDGLIMQNLVDNLLTNTSISMSYQELDFPWAPGQVNTLQFITYFGLAMAVFPAFFGLYPTIERTRQVRALHYSNGVRPLPLWFAYLLFDFTFVLIISAVAVIIFATSVDAWYSLGHLFVCMILYGLASTLLSYVISLYARTQLSAFAFSAGGQAVMFLLYLIAFLTTLTYAPIARLDEILIKVHWGIATITPVGNLVRALLASLNSFQVLCRDEQVTENLGEMLAYGGPITYLIVQCLVLFGVLLWSDSGVWGIGHKLRRKPRRATNGEEAIAEKSEVTDELTRVTSANDGLRVVHLTKQFGKNLAVDNVTFGVSRGEVFALLGPNGAGKTTTINMIRGDMKPDDGDIFVENISVITNRAGARAHLGVCPQFDAMDQMTVVEHLQFYARARGVENVEHNVREVMKAVGLEAYGNRMAAKLSGGNKRKLSLGVALMGNPTAVLLDEPSSGMDAASKRVMWKTLTAVTPGRSLILTTHSMEEADALASRVGILARRMLALGTGTYLRRKHGDKYHIHLVLRSAPYSLQSEMDALKNWILGTFPGAEVEQKSFHGQIRFSVPAQPSRSVSEQAEDMDVITSGAANSGGVSAVFEALEQNKERLGLEYYSVSQTSLEDIFLKIVEEANVAEEGYTRAGKK